MRNSCRSMGSGSATCARCSSGRANLAITLLQRAKDGDRDEACNLLNLALNDARRLETAGGAADRRVHHRADRSAPAAGTQSAEDRPPGRGGARTATAVFKVIRRIRAGRPTQVSAAPMGPNCWTWRPAPLRAIYRLDLRHLPRRLCEASPRGLSSPPSRRLLRCRWTRRSMSFGTARNRRPNDPVDAGKGYSAARDNVVHYGSCRVFIPQSHKIGSIGSPWWKRLLTLTDDRLRLLSVNEFEQSAYWSGIAARLAAIDVAERCALVFVHGYNVSFQEAALRAAQIGFDLSVKGAWRSSAGRRRDRRAVIRPTRRRSRRAKASSPIS